MLSVHGLVAISSEPELSVVPCRNGAFLSFRVASQDLVTKEFHKYPISLFIPEDKINVWKKQIVSGTIFEIAHGRWSMLVKEEYKYPIPSIRVAMKDFRLLKKPFWANEEEKK